MPFAVLDLDLPEAPALYGRKLVLVRPDQHIAWRGDRLPTDFDGLLARVTGHARPATAAAAVGGERLLEENAIDKASF
jgi:hypothetical protein